MNLFRPVLINGGICTHYSVILFTHEGRELQECILAIRNKLDQHIIRHTGNCLAVCIRAMGEHLSTDYCVEFAVYMR